MLILVQDNTTSSRQNYLKIHRVPS